MNSALYLWLYCMCSMLRYVCIVYHAFRYDIVWTFHLLASRYGVAHCIQFVVICVSGVVCACARANKMNNQTDTPIDFYISNRYIEYTFFTYIRACLRARLYETYVESLKQLKYITWYSFFPFHFISIFLSHVYKTKLSIHNETNIKMITIFF